MGLIAAALNAVGGTLASQWKEPFMWIPCRTTCVSAKAETIPCIFHGRQLC